MLISQPDDGLCFGLQTVGFLRQLRVDGNLLFVQQATVSDVILQLEKYFFLTGEKYFPSSGQ